MTQQITAQLFLEPPLCKSAKAGEHNFIGKITNVLESALFRVEYRDISTAESAASDGFSLIHMKQPVGVHGLVMRRVYHYPFWQIEKTHERWNWEVAKTRFLPGDIVGEQAQKFYLFWQKRLFDDLPLQTERKGFVYVPLQGRLLEHRSFQACSPIEMIKYCLVHEPERRIVATLHPKEIYAKAELDALEVLEQKFERLEIRTGQMTGMLQGCDYVVTQNSSAAFAGYFFGKPAMLFGKIDFHHIAVKADMTDLEKCFERVRKLVPDFARYIWWFWQHQSINAGRPDAENKIAERLRHFGWPID